MDRGLTLFFKCSKTTYFLGFEISKATGKFSWVGTWFNWYFDCRKYFRENDQSRFDFKACRVLSPSAPFAFNFVYTTGLFWCAHSQVMEIALQRLKDVPARKGYELQLHIARQVTNFLAWPFVDSLSLVNILPLETSCDLLIWCSQNHNAVINRDEYH